VTLRSNLPSVQGSVGTILSRKFIPAEDDDSSIASDSGVSEMTSSIIASESFVGGDHDDLSLYDDEDCPYRKTGSILSLGPMHEMTSETCDTIWSINNRKCEGTHPSTIHGDQKTSQS
jgi:hypothetical protein